jgi:hypothetical protein
MPQTIISSCDAMGSGFLERLIFRRMHHRLLARLCEACEAVAAAATVPVAARNSRRYMVFSFTFENF